MMAADKDLKRHARNPLLFAKVFLQLNLPPYQQELFKKITCLNKTGPIIPKSLKNHSKAMAYSLRGDNKPVRSYTVKSFVFDDIEPIDRQCDDCIYNWQYFRGAKPDGHCYLFRERVANCAQKRRD